METNVNRITIYYVENGEKLDMIDEIFFGLPNKLIKGFEYCLLGETKLDNRDAMNFNAMLGVWMDNVLDRNNPKENEFYIFCGNVLAFLGKYESSDGNMIVLVE